MPFIFGLFEARGCKFDITLYTVAYPGLRQENQILSFLPSFPLSFLLLFLFFFPSCPFSFLLFLSPRTYDSAHRTKVNESEAFQFTLS